MTVTFPHLGPLHLAVSQLLAYLDIPHIVPPLNDHEALSRGIRISPEEMCFPFKYMAGNLAQAYEMGADTAIMIATGGPCRLGEYGELLKIALGRAGYDYKWILIGSGTGIGIKNIVPVLKELSIKRASTIKIIKGFFLAIKLIVKNDRFRKKLQKLSGSTGEPLDTVKLWHETEDGLSMAGTFDECFTILKSAKHELKRFEIDSNADPIKILVTGEIYTSIEPEANSHLEETLMMMGCSVKRHIDISWWIGFSLFSIVLPERLRRKVIPRAMIRNNVGGYGRETVRKILKDRWYDGVIKIMPAGCMPEIVAKSSCHYIENSNDLKILHLVYDEMSGNAGYETRIEAFVDMLERRKHVLAGNRHRLHKHRLGVDG